MKKIAITIFISTFILIFSCNKTTHLVSIVGNDTDANGCKASAGYQWSKLKNECVKTFELPIQLTNKQQTFSAGVFITADFQKAEVFTMAGDFVLNIQSDNTYLSEKAVDVYVLKKVNNKWQFGNLKNAEPSYKEQ